ncbi:unnamed protein product, partial [Urochloa humidicola]
SPSPITACLPKKLSIPSPRLHPQLTATKRGKAQASRNLAVANGASTSSTAAAVGRSPQGGGSEGGQR